MDAAFGRDCLVPEPQGGGMGVAPLGPLGKLWSNVAALFLEAGSVNAIEGIDEVDLHENGAWVVPVAVAPLSGNFRTDLCAEGLRDAKLEWKEVVCCLFLDRSAQPLGSEAAEGFANGDWADAVVLFRECEERGACEERGD